MKKFLTLVTCATIIIACNNSGDTNTPTTSASDNDTVNKAVIPPPVALDSPSNPSDSAKVKKAMRK